MNESTKRAPIERTLAELPQGDKPPPEPPTNPRLPDGYWYGAATHEDRYWRAIALKRAVEIEALKRENVRLQEALRRALLPRAE